MKVNFAGVGTSFPVLPADLYPANFVAYKYGATKTGKNVGAPNVSFEFDLTGPGLEGRKSYKTFSLLPQAKWALKKACITLGSDESSWPADDLEEGDPAGEMDLDDILNDLINNPCVLALTQQEWKGDMTNSVDAIYEAGTSEITALGGGNNGSLPF